MKDKEELLLVDGDDIIPLQRVRYNIYYNVNSKGKKELMSFKALYKGRFRDTEYSLELNS
jgi:hypothetical protein